MTKEEIDRLLDFISQMVNDDFNEEDYFNFAEELINKYAPGEDIEQAMQDTNFLKGIIARTESKLLDYFEERGYEIEGETGWILSLLPDDRKADILENPHDLDKDTLIEIIISLDSNELIEKYIGLLDGLSNYQISNIITNIENDRIKATLIQRIEGESGYFLEDAIDKISDEEILLECLKNVSGLSYTYKTNKILSISNPEIRKKALKEVEEFNVAEVIKSFDEKERIELIHSIKDINPHTLVNVLNTIEDIESSIPILTKSLEKLDNWEKQEIILQLDSSKRLVAIQNIKFDGWGLVQIIESLEDSDIIIALETIKDLDGYSRLSIIKQIENEETRLDQIAKLEGIGLSQKVSEIVEFKPDAIKKYLDKFSPEILRVLRKTDEIDYDFIKENIRSFIVGEVDENVDVDIAEEVLSRMFDVNNSVVKNINFRILQQKYLDTLGEERINLISCYPEMQNAVLSLSDEQLHLFDKCLDVFVEQNETDEWTVLAQDLLTNIGEFETLIQSIENAENLSKEDIIALSRIMQDENWCEIDSIEEVRDYDTIKAERCQAIMEDENATLEEKRQAVFQKLFGHDASYARKMIDKYGEDIENIDDCDIKDYIRSIKLISGTKDESVLYEIFEQCGYAELDKVSAERELKTAYFDQFLDDLYEPREEDKQDGTSNVYEAGVDFKIIMTSVGAYSGAGVTDDSKSDWNRPVISTQHFCASYIRNDMIGTAPIRSICYGFSSMREDSLMLSGSHDIWSSSDTAVSTAGHGEKYYTPNVQIDKTLSYNEMDIRRMQGGIKLQPDYIIVFRRNGQIDNMEEAQRASEQWDGMPIVIVDVDKCIEAERTKVDTMLAQYRENPTSELAREITQKVRNNRVTDHSFCSDIETELIDLRRVAEANKRMTNEVEVHSESKEESHVEDMKTVDEEQLAENYETVSAEEREQGVSKVREIYRKVKEISRGGKDDGR